MDKEWGGINPCFQRLKHPARLLSMNETEVIEGNPPGPDADHTDQLASHDGWPVGWGLDRSCAGINAGSGDYSGIRAQNCRDILIDVFLPAMDGKYLGRIYGIACRAYDIGRRLEPKDKRLRQHAKRA